MEHSVSWTALGSENGPETLSRGPCSTQRLQLSEAGCGGQTPQFLSTGTLPPQPANMAMPTLYPSSSKTHW